MHLFVRQKIETYLQSEIKLTNEVSSCKLHHSSSNCDTLLRAIEALHGSAVIQACACCVNRTASLFGAVSCDMRNS